MAKSDRQRIDAMVDFRKANLPHDQSDIKTNLTPEALNRCLLLPIPVNRQFPVTALYRGYRIRAKGVT